MVCRLVLSDVFFFKQKTAYEMRIRDWSSDVCSSDLDAVDRGLVDDGADRNRRVHRVADLELADDRSEPRDEIVIDVGVDELAGGQRAALTGQAADGPEDRAFGRRLQVAVGKDEDRKSTRLNSSH